MDEDNLNRFVRSLHSAFVDGDLSRFKSFMLFPLVFYTSAGVTVIRSPSHLMTILGGYRDALTSDGLVPSTYEIKDREPPTNQRMRVLVQFMSQLDDGTTIPGSLIRYFLLETEGTFKIEMLEYLESSLSPSEVERIIH